MDKTYSRILKIFLAVVLVLGLIWTGKIIFEKNYRVLNGEIYSLSLRELDLSGQPLEEPERLADFRNLESLDLRGTGISPEQQQRLQEQLPDCDIRWEILFQKEAYPPETRELTLDSLSMEEAALLDFFPELSHVDARNCRDYEALAELVQHHPDWQVDYTVELAGVEWPRDTRTLQLADVNLAELEQRLPCLPGVETVELTGVLPAAEDLLSCQQARPEVAFSWTVALGGEKYPGSAQHLVPSGIRNVGELEAVLPYFPQLQSVDLRGVPLTDADKQNLPGKYPELRFIWDVIFGEKTFSSDAEEVDLTGQPVSSLDEILRVPESFPNLKKIILCDSGFSNEELDGLNRELGEIRLVWNVDLAGYNLRTDDIYYAPNKYGTSISDEILEPLRYCTDLQCVDIGHSCAAHCEWAACMPQLRYLIMADTGVTDLSPLKDLKNLVFLEIFQTQVKDYSPLLGCTGMEDLNLCYSYGDPEPIKQMTWLKRLWWDGVRISPTILEEALPDTRVECNSHSSTGGGWREGQHYYDMRDMIGMDYMTG